MFTYFYCILTHIDVPARLAHFMSCPSIFGIEGPKSHYSEVAVDLYLLHTYSYTMYFLSSTVPIKDNISASTDEESGIGSTKRSPRRDCIYITIVVILTTALIGLVVYVLGKCTVNLS